MADSYTGTSAVSWDQQAWNKYLYFAYRENNQFDQVANVEGDNLTNPGALVNFFLVNDLAPATTALSETVDVDAVALSDSTVQVALFEQGNAVIETQLLRLTSMLPTNSAIANILGYNASLTCDILAANALVIGSNVRYSNAKTSRVNVAAADVLTTADIRFGRNRLRRANTPPRSGFGGYYAAMLHSDPLFDLLGETGGLGFVEVHKYTDSMVNVFANGEVGLYQGFRFIETTNTPIFTNASNGSGSTGTIDVYPTLLLGDQALAKGYSTADGYGPQPQIIKGPVTDKLMRQQPWGWKHFVGYRRFREASILRIESGSSVGNNAS